MPLPRVLAFDVFGTLVDWRSGIAHQSGMHLAAIGRPDIDPAAFADAWRAGYQPAMAEVREGRRPFVILDTLHREMLLATLTGCEIDVSALDPVLLRTWSLAWHRLDPWPDVAAGLERLRTRFPVVTLSNGNIALMIDLARHGELRWDAILGAEVTRAYKPLPRAYLATADVLGIAPRDLCLVAAHHGDLAAARDCDLLTAYVDRPAERGGTPPPDRALHQQWDWETDSLTGLATLLGC